jgi:hypothetical protein
MKVHWSFYIIGKTFNKFFPDIFCSLINFLKSFRLKIKMSLYNEAGIRRAINKYCEYNKTKFDEPKLFKMDITQLAQEFGEDAFNTKYLNQMWDNLKLARSGHDIRLSPIIFNSLKNYASIDIATSLSPDDFEHQYGKCHPQLNSEAWKYIKCLLRIFQTDPRTRTEI